MLWASDPAGEGTGSPGTMWIGWGWVISQASRIWQLGICTASLLELHVQGRAWAVSQKGVLASPRGFKATDPPHS